MSKNGIWKLLTVSSLLSLHLSFVSPSISLAAEMASETESSQIEELDKSEVPIEEVIEESLEDSESTITETEVEEPPTVEEVEEVEQVEENEVEVDLEKEEVIEVEPEVPESVHSFSTMRAVANKSVNYVATIYQGSFTIDTLPWGQPGFQTLDNTSNYIGKTVRVTQESANGSYGYIHIEGLGSAWIDMRAIKKLDVVSVNYMDYVTSKKYQVDSLPWGTSGFQKLESVGNHLGKLVQILYKTANGSYVYAEFDGQAIGWIDVRAFGLHGNEFTGIITNGNYNIDTLPWGTPGYQKVGRTQEYMGSTYTIKGSTENGAYHLVYSSDEKLGWIDSRAIEQFNSKLVSYQAYIGSGKYNIDTLPWGTPGFKTIGTTDLILGNYVTITQESPNGEYAYVVVNSIGRGWVDKRALGLHGNSYPATIINGSYNVDTLPWGTPGYTKVGNSGDYTGYELEVVGTTNYGNYALVRLNGKDLGWVDVRAIKLMNYKLVNYTSEISGRNYEIKTLPGSERGAFKVGDTTSYVGLSLTVTRESEDGKYLFAAFNGKSLGWIEKRAFGFSPVSYSFYITSGRYNLDSLPWGTIGFQTLGLTDSLIGKELVVVAETQDQAYLKVAYQNQDLGWIDSRAGKKLIVKHLSERGTVANSGYTIDSLPWGTTGFKNLGRSNNHLNKDVLITKESADGQYLFISELSGTPLGWIDRRAMNMKKIVFIDVGHGGSDPGAHYYGVREKDINLEVSLKLQRKLEAAGYGVIMSRTTDTYIDHKTERSEIANKSGADIFISVHHNAMPGNSNVNGIETFWYEYDPDYPSKINQAMHNDAERLLKSSALANEIHNALIRDTGAFNRGVRRDTFAVLRETAIPAVLLELGFMSNQNELNKLTNNSYQEVLAEAVKDGINAYFRLN